MSEPQQELRKEFFCWDEVLRWRLRNLNRDMFRKAKSCSKTFRVLTGISVAALYLLVTTPLAPALTALLALADRSHHVAIQQTTEGVTVLLRHECANSPIHRHGIVARALTLIAQRTSQGQPDHVIQFSASAITVLVSIAPTTIEPASEAPASCDLLICASPAVSPKIPRSPPDTSSSLLSTRSTVLLI